MKPWQAVATLEVTRVQPKIRVLMMVGVMEPGYLEARSSPGSPWPLVLIERAAAMAAAAAAARSVVRLPYVAAAHRPRAAALHTQLCVVSKLLVY